MLVHTGDREFQCKICDRDLSCKESRNQHMLLHTGETLVESHKRMVSGLNSIK